VLLMCSYCVAYVFPALSSNQSHHEALTKAGVVPLCLRLLGICSLYNITCSLSHRLVLRKIPFRVHPGYVHPGWNLFSIRIAYTHTYIAYTHTYTYTYTCTYIAYTHTYTYTYTCTYTYRYMCLCGYVCVYICIDDWRPGLYDA